MSRKRLWVILAVVVALALAAAPALANRDDAPAAGETMPAISFPVPATPAESEYLGLKGGSDSFTLDQVQAKVVIIEFFGLYCTRCRMEAPKVNQTYALLEKEGLGDKVKWFGVGAKNSRIEVKAFKDQLNVPFPLLPDKKLEIYKPLGVKVTPYFLIIKLGGPGQHKVLFSQQAELLADKKLLKLIKENI